MSYTGGVLRYNLPTIEAVLSKKIGQHIQPDMYAVHLIGDEPENLGWFYHDPVRNQYSNYLDYFGDTYLAHQEPASVIHPFSAPIKQLDYYFGSTTPDTHLGEYGRQWGKDLLYRTYSDTKLLRSMYTGKGISYGVNDLLGLVGHLNGFNITIDPTIGRAGTFDYYAEVYPGTEYSSGNRADYSDLSAYFRIDPGYNDNKFTSGDELARLTIEALRSNIYNGQNILSDRQTGNKYTADRRYETDGDSKTIVAGGDFNEEITHYEYTEDKSESSSFEGTTIGRGGASKSFYGNDNVISGSEILRKTNEAFKDATANDLKKRYRTLISRFGNPHDNETNETQTAVDNEFGISHGRNLLKNPKNRDEYVNGYLNPYCRTWTHHHQYSNYARAIRPFTLKKNVADTLEKEYNWVTFRVPGSGARLDSNSVLDTETNKIRITPTYQEGFEKSAIKRCMFSLENLAWKDNTNFLHKDQTGPFGGRIMWFPPYGLSFNESTSVHWGEHEFIGRGEKIYTYTNTEREGNISFMVLIDHPNILNHWNGTNKGSKPEGRDNVDQQLLRYYAGCDIPYAKENIDQRYKLHRIEEDKLLEGDDKLMFYVFFPNDYSGSEEDKEVETTSGNINLGQDVYFPIMYLLNGVGTQEVATSRNETKVLYYKHSSSDNNYIKKYESIKRASVETSEYSGMCHVDKDVYYGFTGGYEMHTSGDTKGQSLVEDSSDMIIPNVVVDDTSSSEKLNPLVYGIINEYSLSGTTGESGNTSGETSGGTGTKQYHIGETVTNFNGYGKAVLKKRATLAAVNSAIERIINNTELDDRHSQTKDNLYVSQTSARTEYGEGTYAITSESYSGGKWHVNVSIGTGTIYYYIPSGGTLVNDYDLMSTGNAITLEGSGSYIDPDIASYNAAIDAVYAANATHHFKYGGIPLTDDQLDISNVQFSSMKSKYDKNTKLYTVSVKFTCIVKPKTV